LAIVGAWPDSVNSMVARSSETRPLPKRYITVPRVDLSLEWATVVSLRSVVAMGLVDPA